MRIWVRNGGRSEGSESRQRTELHSSVLFTVQLPEDGGLSGTSVHFPQKVVRETGLQITGVWWVLGGPWGADLESFHTG